MVLELHDQIADVAGHQRIDHGGRLVVENGLGIFGQRSRDSHGALCSGAEIGGKAIREVRNLEHGEKFLDAPVSLLFTLVTAGQHGKGDIFRHGKRIEKRARLKNHRCGAANLFKLFLGEIRDVFAADYNAARIGLEKAEQQFQRDGFADAAASHDYGRLAAIDEKADVC